MLVTSTTATLGLNLKNMKFPPGVCQATPAPKVPPTPRQKCTDAKHVGKFSTKLPPWPLIERLTRRDLTPRVIVDSVRRTLPGGSRPRVNLAETRTL